MGAAAGTLFRTSMVMTATIDDDSVWFSVVMPTAGSILGFFLGFAAVPTMMNDRKVGKLSVDPVPYPVAFTTCFAWCFYGTVIGDPWPFVGNILPVLGNAFCVITALRLCDDPRTAAMTEWITIGGILLLLVLLLVCVSDFVIKDHTLRGAILGNTCICLCIVQFSSPCIEALRAVRTGDARKISLPLAVTGSLCSFFWSVYGLTAGLSAIWIPNVAGFALAGTVCIVKLCVGKLSGERLVSTLRTEVLEVTIPVPQ